MARHRKRRSDRPENGPSAASLPPGADYPVVEACVAVNEQLSRYLASRLEASGETTCPATDISDGLLISVLRLIAPDSTYPMDKGRFWQLLDRYRQLSPSSAEDAVQTHLTNDIEVLFAAAENESFEDGFDSAFSLELLRVVLKYGDAAVAIVSDLILQNRVAPQVAVEALRCLGEMESEATHESRRLLLERSLGAVSHIVRDGAVVALSHLADPRSAAAVDAAASREQYRLLRVNMLTLLVQLKGHRP